MDVNKLDSQLATFLGDDRICLVDVGSSGGLEPRWRRIEAAVSSVMFEPNPHDTTQFVDGNSKVFNCALGSRPGQLTLHVCAKNQASSFLKPDHDLVARFPDAARFEVVHEEQVKVATLDDVLGEDRARVEFIKLDTQGTELDILEGAETVLDGAVCGLEVEVEFLAIYRDQPLFGTVCSHLAARGYEFMDFTNICRWERDGFTQFGQAIFGDGLFLRSPENFAEIASALESREARRKTKAYFAICALYARLDLMKLAFHLNSSRWSDAERKQAEQIIDQSEKNRKQSAWIIAMANRILDRTHALAKPIS